MRQKVYKILLFLRNMLYVIMDSRLRGNDRASRMNLVPTFPLTLTFSLQDKEGRIAIRPHWR